MLRKSLLHINSLICLERYYFSTVCAVHQKTFEGHLYPPTHLKSEEHRGKFRKETEKKSHKKNPKTHSNIMTIVWMQEETLCNVLPV